MSTLVLPRSVHHERAKAQQEQMVNRVIGRAHAFDKLLKDMDHRLDLVLVNEKADIPGAIPGYWHVRRRNDPPATDTWYPIAGPNGEWTEPTHSHIEFFQQRDLWKAENAEKLRKHSERVRNQYDRQAEQARLERIGQLSELQAFHNRTQILVPSWR